MCTLVHYLRKESFFKHKNKNRIYSCQFHEFPPVRTFEKGEACLLKLRKKNARNWTHEEVSFFAEILTEEKLNFEVCLEKNIKTFC